MYVFERSLWLVLDNGTERRKCKKGDHKTIRTKERDGRFKRRSRPKVMVESGIDKISRARKRSGIVSKGSGSLG